MKFQNPLNILYIIFITRAKVLFNINFFRKLYAKKRPKNFRTAMLKVY